MEEESILASLGEDVLFAHETLRDGATALHMASERIEDPTLSQAVDWAAVALAYSHFAFDKRAAEIVAANN